MAVQQLSLSLSLSLSVAWIRLGGTGAAASCWSGEVKNEMILVHETALKKKIATCRRTEVLHERYPTGVLRGTRAGRAHGLCMIPSHRTTPSRSPTAKKARCKRDGSERACAPWSVFGIAPTVERHFVRQVAGLEYALTQMVHPKTSLPPAPFRSLLLDHSVFPM